MKPGDILHDNDPRSELRTLTVVSAPVVTERGARRTQAKDRCGQMFWIAARRIHADGKPRRTGFRLEARS